jgi:CheY-like chemotaxis protein
MMLSSAGRHEDATRCRVLGVDSYLSKPVTQSDLFDATVDALHFRAAKTPGSLSSPALAVHDEPIPALKSLNILLAEDNAINQKLAVRVLELMGHRITTAVNGKLALNALESQTFDLILMDLQMPEMDGLEATRLIREQERGGDRHMPIVAMTAHALKGDRERCLDAGMDGYVAKPINPDELAREIAAAVSGAVQEAGRPEPQPADDVLDRDRIESLKQMDAKGDLLQELIAIFREECPCMVDDVRRALDCRDAVAVNRKTHALKGSLLSLGAIRASAEAQRLEKVAEHGLLDEAATRFTSLTREIERFQTALQSFSGQCEKIDQTSIELTV